MAPKELSRYQLSSRLSYDRHIPPFLLKLQNRVAGVPEEEDEYYENDGSGRPPIPKRPSIPQRPDDEPGSADEESGDEKPQVVVLKEGKHLTEREAENERRRQKGLPLLGDPTPSPPKPDNDNSIAKGDKLSKVHSQTNNLSFSSSRTGLKPSAGKRKAVGDPEDTSGSQAKSSVKKKVKKPPNAKTLLSFSDDA